MPPPSLPNDRLSNSRFNLNSLNLISRYLNQNSNLHLSYIPSELRNITMDSDEDADYEIINEDDDIDDEIDDDIDDDDIDDDDNNVDVDVDANIDADVDVDNDDPQDEIDIFNEDDYNSEVIYPNIDEVMNHDLISDSDDSQEPSNLLNLYNMMYNDFPFGHEDDERWHQHSSERLLLSSARNNYTNSNTLINSRTRSRYPSSHYRQLMLSNEFIDSTPPLAIPLSRQNAIRKKSHQHNNGEKRKLTKFKPCFNEEANKLYIEIDNIINQIDLNCQLSPIFIMTDLKTIKLKKDLNKDILFHNLDDYMDDFLKSRLRGDLWCRNLRKGRKKRKFSNKDNVQFKSNKKQKIFTKHDSGNDDLVVNDVPKFDKLFQNLANEQKDAILDIQYCSLFTAGSCFSMTLPNSSQLLSDLKLINVDYSNKSIEALFNLFGDSPKDLFDKITQFKIFLLGNFNSCHQNLPKNNSLFRKINILDRLCHDSKIFQNMTLLNDKNDSYKINLASYGSMIDFKKYDLRFLLKLYKIDKQKIKTFHSSRLKANSVRIQLSEWMKLQPFVQFKQSFFLTYLNRLHLNLKKFSESKAPAFIKQETIHRAKVFKSNIYELTKDFGIANDNFKPKEQDTLPSLSKRDNNFFMDDWKKSLAEKLSDQLTNSTTTLLNIQLNYILFTLELDLSNFLSQSIEFILKQCQKVDQNHISKYSKIYNSVLADEARFGKSFLNSPRDQKLSPKQFKQAIILCSLNRKTGEIQIHNTLPFLNSRNLSPLKSDYILSRRRGMFPTPDEDSLVNDFESFSSSEGETEPEQEQPGGSYTFRPIDETSTKTAYDRNTPTELFGHIKRHNQGESFGGGHPVFECL